VDGERFVVRLVVGLVGISIVVLFGLVRSLGARLVMSAGSVATLGAVALWVITHG
jgi:hypothetical protein